MTTSTGTRSNLTRTGVRPILTRKHFENDAAHTGRSIDQTSIIDLLNQTLAAEVACVFRYRRHHFIARDIQATDLADEFLLDAKEKLEHAHKISARIVELGGTSELDRDAFSADNPTQCMTSRSALEMIAANLAAERSCIDRYLDLIQRIDDKDPITSDLLKAILVDEEVQAGALAHLLTQSAGAESLSSQSICTQ